MCLIAGIVCPVPDLAAQRLILVLNAARGGAHASADVHRAWTTASTDERGGVERLVADLGAEVGFAAGTGALERFRHAREYDLWRIASEAAARPSGGHGSRPHPRPGSACASRWLPRG